MKPFSATIALAALALPIAGSMARANEATAGFRSAGQLVAQCRSSSAYGRSACFAYIAAVADSARAYRMFLGLDTPCIPADASQGQLVDAVVQYVTANPSSADSQAASVVITAFQSAYPCGSRAAADQSVK